VYFFGDIFDLQDRAYDRELIWCQATDIKLVSERVYVLCSSLNEVVATVFDRSFRKERLFRVPKEDGKPLSFGC
jgi:hypothetical protein